MLLTRYAVQQYHTAGFACHEVKDCFAAGSPQHEHNKILLFSYNIRSTAVLRRREYYTLAYIIRSTCSCSRSSYLNLPCHRQTPVSADILSNTYCTSLLLPALHGVGSDMKTPHFHMCHSEGVENTPVGGNCCVEGIVRVGDLSL